jgi:prephenate dehydrogenase
MTVGIVGTGLIGGSIGMGLISKGHKVLGYDANSASAQTALRRNCVTEIGSLEEVSQAEVVFCAVPPAYVNASLGSILTAAPTETVVTDCTSIKLSVMQYVTQNFPNAENFVGGHPMAGHEKSGPAFASQWMFRGARWLISPTSKTKPWATNRLELLVAELGASPVKIAPEKHDRHVAILSHLPHAIAAILVQFGDELEKPDVAGGSWKDLTRVGGVDPELWSQIMLGNREEFSTVLREFQARIETIKSMIDNQDEEALKSLLAKSQKSKAKQIS